MSTQNLYDPPFDTFSAPNQECLDSKSSTVSENNRPPNEAQKQRSHVPDQPGVALCESDVHSFLTKELCTPVLDELYPRLWVIASKSGRHIDALHVQRIKGREIIPSEDPQMHLVWRHNQVYVKPVPICLLNHSFWKLFLKTLASPAEGSRLAHKDSTWAFDRSLAVGFIRTYAFLIQHRADFEIARERYLIPQDADWIQWAKFLRFFKSLPDNVVAKRYHYGQIRLNRLHWEVWIFRPRTAGSLKYYHQQYWSIHTYIERGTAPFIFIFASLSVALSAMQVACSVYPTNLTHESVQAAHVRAISRAFWGSSMAILVFTCAVWLLVITLPLAVLLTQFVWAFRKSRDKIICRLDA